MALGKLVAASALEVTPQQQSDFEGGDVANLVELQVGLDEAATKGNLVQGLAVTLKVDQNRCSPVRDAVMLSAFGSPEDRLRAVEALAVGLGHAMDKRSSICLLVVSVHEQHDMSRQVVTWTFPHERVIRRSGGKVDINEAFSLNSRLRKAALLSGHNNRNGFLTAHVLDQQTTSTERIAADFWIVKFLEAEQQIGTSEGTTLAATVFRKTHEGLDPPEQQTLQTAIASVRTLTDRKWSLEMIATELLPQGNAQKQFLKTAGKGDVVTATFAIDQQEFDRLVGFHIFTLASGVRVSAPASQIGVGVIIDESAGVRTLLAEGVVVDEKLSKHA
jgi:hypothetical protein